MACAGEAALDGIVAAADAPGLNGRDMSAGGIDATRDRCRRSRWPGSGDVVDRSPRVESRLPGRAIDSLAARPAISPRGGFVRLRGSIGAIDAHDRPRVDRMTRSM
jgi:hypothetical protein